MIYLIDYENVSNNGLKGVELLEDNDRIIIFYSKNAGNISMKTHKNLEITKAEKEYIEVNVASKNALDFQLSTYLGALTKEFPDDHFAIVSKDKGYKAVVDFWKKHHRTIFSFTSVSKTEEKNLQMELKLILKNNSDKIVEIAEIINKYKTKQGINNALVKKYKSEVGGTIYKEIKPILSEKR